MRVLALAVFLVSSVLVADEVVAPNIAPAMTQGLAFDQKLGQKVPADLGFVDEMGNPVRLGDYWARGPVILVPAYYNCPNVCTAVIRGVFQALQGVRFSQSSAYQVVFFSIDPKETSEMGLKKKKNFIKSYRRSDIENDVHFLTGNERSIQALTAAIGFKYRWEDSLKQYVHPAGIVVVTPSGKLSRYLYGGSCETRDVRLSLVEASENKIGNRVDHVLLYCFKYDPSQGKYGFVIMSSLRWMGLITMAVLAGLIFGLLRTERRRRHIGKEQSSVR